MKLCYSATRMRAGGTKTWIPIPAGRVVLLPAEEAANAEMAARALKREEEKERAEREARARVRGGHP